MQTHTPLHEQTFVVVDLETTGASARYDRVIELAAIRVRAGIVEDCLETLVDPRVAIPPFITRLTGISAATVRGRPTVEQVLPELRRFTAGAVLVAHNASFDHGFLAQAFQRAAISWECERLCTLRLARRLAPGLPSYKLDSLCAHLGLSYVQRHRARPDAEATVSLLGHLLQAAREQGIDRLGQLLQLQQRSVGGHRRKGRVDEAQVASLPAGPGVYLLKDAQGHVVYVGKSVNVRQRVRQHLRPSGTVCSAAQPALRKRLPFVADVEAIETGSELEALFLESRLVKRYLPDANRLLRDYRDYPFVKLDLREPFPRLVATRERPADGALYFGPFRRASVVASVVDFLNEQLGLRQCGDPRRAGGSACPLLEMRRCLGPCTEAARPEAYRAAVREAERILHGEDRTLLERLAERRDQLADALRFEEAAVLRDRIRDLELLVGAQQRLQAFAERHLVVITRAAAPRTARLFLVRAGRLAEECSLPVPASTQALRGLLRAVYRETVERPVARDELDDILILDAWLRRHRDVAREVPVPPEEPEDAVPALRQTIASLTSSPV